MAHTIVIENVQYTIPFGDYKVSSNTYAVNGLGIFRTTNFGTQKIWGDNNRVSENERLIVDIELRGLYRTIVE